MTRFSKGSAKRADGPDESQHVASWYTPGLSDAIGDRLLMFDNTTSSSLELLRFRPEFGKAPGFEDALRRRVEELENFTHPSIAKVRAVELLGEDDGLALVSNHTVGRRLSEIQQEAHGPQFATELISQLVPVLAALQEQGQGMAHGLLTPERIIVTPEGRLVLSEHVLASAIDALRLPTDKLRDKLGIVMPAGRSTLDDPRADIVQLGYLALSLLVGRRLRSLDAAREIVKSLERQTLGPDRDAPRHLHSWLVRALQVDGSSFDSANEAERALTEWPERASEDDLPREVAAAPVPPVKSITARPPDIKLDVKPGIPTPVVPEPTPSQTLAFEPEAAEAFLPEEPEPLPPGSLLGLRPTPVSRPAATERLLPSLEEAARSTDVFREAPAPPSDTPVWLKPTERRKSEPVRFQIEPSAEPEVERAVVGRDAAPAARLRPRAPVAHYLVAGLAFVCLVESLIIAGLLASRGAAAAAAGTARTAQTTAAPSPAKTQESPIEAPAVARPTPPAQRLAAADVKPAAAATPPPVTVTRGWLTIEAPFELQIFEGNRLLGTTRSQRISLLAGPHDLRLVSKALNFDSALKVEIPAGVGITTRVAAPNGTLSLNAMPWANVSLDGRSLGTTPVMNLSVPVGRHEVIWRHPQLGERRQTAVVTARGPVTLTIDLRR